MCYQAELIYSTLKVVLIAECDPHKIGSSGALPLGMRDVADPPKKTMQRLFPRVTIPNLVVLSQTVRALVGCPQNLGALAGP